MMRTTTFCVLVKISWCWFMLQAVKHWLNDPGARLVIYMTATNCSFAVASDLTERRSMVFTSRFGKGLLLMLYTCSIDTSAVKFL